MLDARQDFALGRPVTGQLVRDDDAGHVGEILAQPPEELLRGGAIPTALHQDIEDGAVLIHGPPEVVLHAVDADEHLVEVPRIARAGALATQRVGVGLAELAAPLAQRLIGDDHPALGEQLLDIPVAEREAEVQPDGVRDDLGREPMAFVAGCGSVFVHAQQYRTPSLS